jgi:hypothetical protein
MEARQARTFAEKRLKTLGETANVALNQRKPEIGCKRLLPATGTVINADCDE